MVRATLLLPGCPPERALAAFTDPATLRQWWGGELTVTPAGPATARQAPDPSALGAPGARTARS
jgi:uncharacterized protein YndB with AHSA1/START domain